MFVCDSYLEKEYTRAYFSVCINVPCVCVDQYTQYLELQSVDEARAVFKRACEVHLTYKPNIHMHWATFEERHGTTQRTVHTHTLLFAFLSSFLC